MYEKILRGVSRVHYLPSATCTGSLHRPVLVPYQYHSCSGGSDVGGAGAGEVRFDRREEVTRGKNIWELFRGWLVFKLFTYNTIVDNSMKLYVISKRVFGRWLTGKFLKATAFGQFVGGTDEADTQPAVCRLAERGISSIWFFSIERDQDEVPVPASQAESEEQERSFDEVNRKYLKSIEMSASCNCDHPVRFAAIKLTAICSPHLLNKLNILLRASEKTFISLASPGKHTVDKTIQAKALNEVIPGLKLEGTSPNRMITITDWTKYFSVVHGHTLQHFQLLKALDSSLVSFSEMEKDQHRRFIQRLVSIGELAESTGVCVLVDAEQTYFQAAIDHVTLHLLSLRHNITRPLIYNTLQTYLVKSYDDLLTYMDAAKHYNIKVGIKVVRGCYIEQERERAANSKESSPIHATKLLTDESYHTVLDRLMSEVKTKAASIMVATHNKETVRKALDLMKEHELPWADGRVSFGQLLGMGDHLTYPLASAGYFASKVVPYGTMDNLMPFLCRRGNENRSMMKNAREERMFYFQELKQRLVPWTI